MGAKRGNYELPCVPLADGIGIGYAMVYRDLLTHDISCYKISRNDIHYELRRINHAMDEVQRELFTLSRQISQNISVEDGEIFSAQRAILEDPVFIAEIKTGIQNELVNAEQAVRNVFRKYIRRFSESEHMALQSKADDLRDILRKILKSLLGIQKSVLEKLPPKTIVVTRRLLPSDTINLDKTNITGIVIQEGNVHSHSTLLARALSIPAVCAHDLSLEKIRFRAPMVIDGTEGKIFIGPPKQIVKVYQSKHRNSLLKNDGANETIRHPVKTLGGKTITIYANSSDESEVAHAVSNGCDGIGLFRTEILYFGGKILPTEQILYKKLEKSLKTVGDRVVTLRVLDIDGDKNLPYLETGKPLPHSFLGLRGIRLLLKNPELLQAQLNVFVRLRKLFNVRILLPMITLVEEIDQVRCVLNDCLKKKSITENQRKIEVGSMIETPAAVFSIKKIIEASDFVSIGTNDLTQYVMAAGRENPEVAFYYDKGVQLIYSLVEIVAKAAQEQGKECSICGELANNISHLKRFIQAGIRHFSVSPHLIPKIKKYIQTIY